MKTSKPVSARISDPSLISWLEDRQNISDTVREALIRMKQGEELSEDLQERIDFLRRNDEEALAILRRLDKQNKNAPNQ